jgi:hypothetical protein
MRIRAVTLLTSLVTVGALVVGASVADFAEAKGPPKAAPCAGSTKAAAIKQIKSAFDFFLNGTTKPPRANNVRKGYIAGMSDPALSALFDKNFVANAAMAATTSVKVNKVTCTGKNKADVTADLILSGKATPGIFPNPGGAVIENGVWKASKQTLCDLIALADSTVTQAGQPCAP